MKEQNNRIVHRFANNISGKAAAFLEMLFLALSGIYLFWSVSLTTQFMLQYPEWMENALLWSMSVTAVLRMFFIGIKRKEFWIGLGLAAVYLLVYRSDGYTFFLFLAILTVGYINIDYRKILKVFVCAAGTVVCTTIVTGIAGGILDYTYFREGVRSSLGMNYPTDCASIVLFILLMLWLVRKQVPDFLMLLAGIGSALLSYFINQSRTSFICSLIFIAAVLFEMLFGGVLSRFPKLQRIPKVVYGIASFTFPLYALFYFAAMFLYQKGSGLGTLINSWMSSRINLSIEAFHEYGLHAFGTPFEMKGFGSSLISVADYDFVDSSYPLILLRYGWIILIVVCILMVWLARKAVRSGNGKIALVVGIIALHALSEHHVMDAYYNILLVMPLAAYGSRQVSETGIQIEKIHRKQIAELATVVLGVVLAFFLLPSFFTRLRTVLQIKELCGGGENGFVAFGLVFGLLVLIAAFLTAVYHLLLKLITGQKEKAADRKNILVWLAVLVLSIGLFVSYLLVSNHWIRNEAKEQQTIINEEKEVLELAATSATGYVYADEVPGMYQVCTDAVRNAILSGDEIARSQNTTILMNRDQEHRILFNCGFLYVPVSEKHAFYTNDQGVINTLQEAGFHLTGYYNESSEIDLAYEAELNNLVYNPDNGLQLEGEEHRLFYGTGEVLYKGRYTAFYDLELPEELPLDDKAACTLRISSDWGEKVQAEKTIYRNQFAENRQLSVPVTVNYGTDTTGVEFLIRTSEGQKVSVKRISYIRTPDYDVHATVDNRYRNTKEEYYTLDGEPTVTNEKYHIRELGYDSYGNTNFFKYYDIDQNPVLYRSSYAELHRQYNSIHNIVLEEYYGVDGERIALPSGESIIRYEYDRAGNRTKCTYLDTKEQPVITSRGYAELHQEYDSKKNLIQKEYYGANNERIAINSGECIERCTYDDDGNVISYAYYDENNQPVITTRGFAEVKLAYDEEGQITEKDYFGSDGLPYMQDGGYFGWKQTWDEDNYIIERTYLDDKRNETLRFDGFSRVVWNYNNQGKLFQYEFLNSGKQVTDTNKNLAMDLLPLGSSWMVPQYRVLNSCFSIGCFRLGEKTEGDLYTCQIKIEFKDVSAADGEAFRFYTQGSVDGRWDKGNPWNSSLINLDTPPEDGIYYFTSTVPINAGNMDAEKFEIGFRCDNWESGSFRVLNVKVEKGDTPTDWEPGL